MRRPTPASSCVRLAAIVLGGLAAIASPARAACPPGVSVPITSGTGTMGVPLVFSFRSDPGNGGFFILGAGDENSIGSVGWVPLGDLDGDGRTEYRLDVPGTGPGGWGDESAHGCPATLPTPYPPLVIHDISPLEDWDDDGKWDVFEDRNHNGRLDFGEDLDGDGQLTPRFRLTSFGNFPGCEGATREDVDCDGHLDIINEDLNSNGFFDLGEDLDGDRRLDAIIEDRNGNGVLDFIDQNGNGRFDSGEPTEDTNNNGRLDVGFFLEDRNYDRILNDRPAPAPDDRIFAYNLDGTSWQLDPSYPYLRFRPLQGGVLIASVAWNGQAYDFDTINTPTRRITLDDGREYRIVDQAPIDTLVPHVSAVRWHRQRPFAYRLHVDPLHGRRVDDAGGRRVIFDAYKVDLLPDPFDYYCEGFLETGETSAVVGAGGGFLSVVTLCLSGGFEVIKALQVLPRSTGSNTLLDGYPGIPVPRLRNSIFDRDRDFVSLPYDLCPDVSQPPPAIVFDSNFDGTGDACDPSSNPQAPVEAAWEFHPDPAEGPGARPGAAAAYDADRGVVVLYGGLADAATWEYDGASWRRLDTPHLPTSRRGHRMTYDSAHRRVLLFGGGPLDPGPLLNELWAYDGLDWTRIETRGAPPPAFANPNSFSGTSEDFGLAWDDARKVLVLVHALGQTWEIGEERIWRRIPTSRAPSPRAGMQVGYDPVRRVTVLHGGVELPGPDAPSAFPVTDTWEFDGGSWQEVDARGDVIPTYGGAMAHDTARRTMLNFGGNLFTQIGAPNSPERRFFSYDSAATRPYAGASWSSLVTRPTIPPQRTAVAAYDTRRHTLVVHGQINPYEEIGLTAELRWPEDSDHDAVRDPDDNCPLRPNPDQADFDRDGWGDACDNCLETPNPTQRDLDGDARGDDCDADRDGDGVANETDACPSDYIAGRPQSEVLGGGGPDSDGDGTPDDCDRCPRDAADDPDGDGICGDADNCPTAFNPGQEDSTNDGSGDACQPVLVLEGVLEDGGETLEVSATASDPNGDRLGGSIEFFAIEEILLRALDPENPADFCATDTYPAGNPGTGLFYFAAEGFRILADLDSNFGCDDGSIDFVVADTPCKNVIQFDPSIVVNHVPRRICVAPWYEPDPGHPPADTLIDLTIEAFDDTQLRLARVAAAPALSIPFDDGLPATSPIPGLDPDQRYLLRITVSDGNSLPVQAETTFLHQSEQVMVIPRSGPTAIIQPPTPGECTGPWGGRVTLDGSASTAGDGTANGLSYLWYEDYGQPGERFLGEGPIIQPFLPLGDHAIALRVTGSFPRGGGSGPIDVAHTIATVRDTVAPTLVLETTPHALWPPNHRMVPVQIAWMAYDACDQNPALRLLSVTSNEADDAADDEDGRTAGDIAGADLGTADTEILLRAERLGAGSGRIYEIAGEVMDASGHRSPALVLVTVPHDLGSGPDPVMLKFARGSGTGTLDLVWGSAPGATRYDISFGDLGTLRNQRSRTTLVATREKQIPSEQTSIADPSDPARPAPGTAWFYLVQYHDDHGPTGYGTATALWPMEMILPDP